MKKMEESATYVREDEVASLVLMWQTKKSVRRRDELMQAIIMWCAVTTSLIHVDNPRRRLVQTISNISDSVQLTAILLFYWVYRLVLSILLRR